MPNVRVLRAAAATVAAATSVALSAPTPANAASALGCRASMSNARPEQYSTTDVVVHTARRAGVSTVAHYKTTTTAHWGRADRRGTASIPYRLSRATAGYRVRVAVTVRVNGRVGHCATSFVPR